MRARARGASCFEYSALLLVVVGAGLAGVGALSSSTAQKVRAQGDCVQTLDCGRGHASPVVASPPLPDEAGGASTAWDGALGEMAVSASELGRAAVSPGDVLRGASLAVAHPRAALRVVMKRGAARAPASSSAPPPGSIASDGSEERGRDAVRVVMLGAFAIGRLATMGARASHGGNEWDVPRAPELPDDPLATPGGST